MTPPSNPAWPPAHLSEETTATPKRLVEACYDMISFEAGAEPSWDTFKSLFVERAVMALRVFPGDERITVMDLDEYALIQMREGMLEEGYTETIVNEDWFRSGDVAATRVEFEMKFGNDKPIPAVDLIQLVSLDDRWWIVSITSEVLAGGKSSR
jgi:hypothetical protein